MKSLKLLIYSFVLLFGLYTTVAAQSTHVTETFKKHFNATVEKVQAAENADDKRDILNDSFSRMLTAVERIESLEKLSREDLAKLDAFRRDIEDRKNELNGLRGFQRITDEDLDDFSSFSQQAIEQADRTVTISLTTVLLVIIILLLI